MQNNYLTLGWITPLQRVNHIIHSEREIHFSSVIEQNVRVHHFYVFFFSCVKKQHDLIENKLNVSTKQRLCYTSDQMCVVIRGAIK